MNVADIEPLPVLNRDKQSALPVNRIAMEAVGQLGTKAFE